MTSQPGLQAIPIHTLPDISQNKDNQNITREAFFFKTYCGK